MFQDSVRLEEHLSWPLAHRFSTNAALQLRLDAQHHAHGLTSARGVASDSLSDIYAVRLLPAQLCTCSRPVCYPGDDIVPPKILKHPKH